MRKAFHKDNRRVPLGIMLLTVFVFLFHFRFRQPGPLDETEFVPEKLAVEDGNVNTPVDYSVQHAEVSSGVSAGVSAGVPSAVPLAVPSSVPTVPVEEQEESLTTDDVVLMLKTGATVLWKRLPIHLATSLAHDRVDPKNVLIYSDYPERIGSWEIIDVLANTPESARQSDTFQAYLQLEDYESRQNYAEISNMPGDAAGPPGGWKLDKHKFLPIIQHAGRNRPRAKWYVFMEDDSYIFLSNLVRHLDRFNYTDAWYLGSLAWIHGDYFAHGGSGFALSRAAWEQSFGRDPDIVERFESFTREHGCGDHILGHVLREYGVEFGETHGDSRFTYGFNPEPHWSTWYEPANWCKPVYSWHHTHSKDVARLYDLERSWDTQRGPLRYRDIFHKLVAPFLRHRAEWWDNGSSKHEVRSNNAAGLQPPSSVGSPEVWRNAWKSVDACEAACVAWGECVQWSFYEDRCKMDSMVRLGSGIPEGDSRRQTSLPWTSGWFKSRVEGWTCQE